MALNISETLDDFVLLMNNKAKELKMFNTNFTNVEGLHNPDQVTTANDMVTLLDYALENDEFKEIFTSKEYQTIPSNEHPQGIKLLSTVFLAKEAFDSNDTYIIGGKTGYTPEAGRSWATLGVKNNVEYISIVMGAYAKDGTFKHSIHIEDTLSIFELLYESDD